MKLTSSIIIWFDAVDNEIYKELRITLNYSNSVYLKITKHIIPYVSHAAFTWDAVKNEWCSLDICYYSQVGVTTNSDKTKIIIANFPQSLISAETDINISYWDSTKIPWESYILNNNFKIISAKYINKYRMIWRKG